MSDLYDKFAEQYELKVAAETKVEAARALVGKWRVNNVDTLEYRLRRELADELAAALDPPHEEPAVRMTCRCGAEIEVFERNGIVDVVGPLSEHFETCPAVES